MEVEIIGGMPGAPPAVGQTIHCTQPVVTGGIGPFQFSYAWSENNAIVFEQRFLSNCDSHKSMIRGTGSPSGYA